MDHVRRKQRRIAARVHGAETCRISFKAVLFCRVRPTARWTSHWTTTVLDDGLPRRVYFVVNTKTFVPTQNTRFRYGSYSTGRPSILYNSGSHVTVVHENPPRGVALPSKYWTIYTLGSGGKRRVIFVLLKRYSTKKNNKHTFNLNCRIK